MSEALRSVFAELGFNVDVATLDRADKSLKDYIAKATAADKASAKAGAAAKTAMTAEERLAKIRAGAADAQQQHQAQVAFNASDEGKKHAAWRQVIDDEAEAAAKARDLSKSLSTYGGIVDHISTKFHTAFGESLTSRFPKLGAAAKKAGVDVEGVGKVVAGASAAAVGAMALASRAAFSFASAFSADAEALRDTARESRVTTTQLQELDHAAVQGGVGAERMRAGIATLGASLRSAERWGNGTTSTLRRLGISARDASGHIRPTGEIVDEIAVAMEHIESPTRRARVATELFGESGRRMLDVLHTGPGGIAALRAELAALGGGVTPEATAAARQYTQATEKLSRAQDSLRSVLAVALLPALSWVVEKGARVGGMLANLTRGTHVTEIALVGLATAAAAAALPIIVAWAPVALPFVVMAAKIALVVALLDDLITFVDGGDSAIGRLIDSIAGVGTAAEFVKELRDDWEAVTGAVERAIAAVARFTGIETHQAEATLRAPRFGAPTPRTRPSAGSTSSSGITVAPASTMQTIPATRTVMAPGSVSQHVVSRVTNRNSAPVLHFHGVTDAAVIADRVRTALRREDADARDGSHPVEDEDE